MGWHNETCGCAECGNYGQQYNHKAVHNQSCGCAECGNYGPTADTRSAAVTVPIPTVVQPTPASPKAPAPGRSAPQPAAVASALVTPPSKKRKGPARKKVSQAAKPEVEMVAVPAELLDEVRALIASRHSA